MEQDQQFQTSGSRFEQDKVSLSDFIGDDTDQDRSAPAGRNGRWKPTPLEGGSRLWAFGAGYISGRIRTRGRPEKLLDYVKNYMETVVPILNFVEFDRVAGFGGLESLDVEMDDSTRFKIGIGALILSALLVTPEKTGPSLSDLLDTFAAAGGDPLQVAQAIAKNQAESGEPSQPAGGENVEQEADEK